MTTFLSNRSIYESVICGIVPEGRGQSFKNVPMWKCCQCPTPLSSQIFRYRSSFCHDCGRCEFCGDCPVA